MASPPLCSFCHGRFTFSSSKTIHEDLLYLLLLSTFLGSLPNSVLGECKNPPVIFNFGDSNSDTGGLVAGLGYSINFPNGRTFFRRSTGRLSDGRLIIDFLCMFSLNAPFSHPHCSPIFCSATFFLLSKLLSLCSLYSKKKKKKIFFFFSKNFQFSICIIFHLNFRENI